ncbi:hypothetical protein E4U54_004261 [Claviceps lovelessii]|nr:hypothetical protein E4U54_004261 [Claviceps lovelessii]
MPLPPRAAGGFATLIMSDSEPDFDDVATLTVTQSRGNDQKLSTGNNQRHMDGSIRVTKSAKCLARSQGGLKRVGQPAMKRELSTDKANNSSLTSVPSCNDMLPAQSVSHNSGSQVTKNGWSRHIYKGARRAKDKSEYTSDPAHCIEETMTHDDDSQLQDVEHCLDAVKYSKSSQEVVRSRDVEVSKPTSSSDTGQLVVGKQSDELRERYNALEARHVQLREVGVKAAECNFERLKRQSMETAAASTILISELKAELALQSDMMKQNEQLGRQLDHSRANVDELEKTISDLTASLAKAKSEIQSLSAKLGAMKAVEVAMKAPTSMAKTVFGGAKSTSSGALLAAQAKEDLYSDLTGLIVRGTNQINGETVFDCIQTGRNGTLHFKLALEAGEDPEKYDDIQFTYRPQLDSERDRDLVMVLPDYLVEEITFTRTQASNFYGKLNRSLTERLN